MRNSLVALAALLLAACATPYDTQEIEAVRDYIVANELTEVDRIRTNFRQFNYSYLNDQYVTIPTQRGDYLVEFDRLCRDLRRTDFTYEMVDRRNDANTLRARFDTIRGCRIGKIYEVTEAQREELAELGDAPGDEIFLPEPDTED